MGHFTVNAILSLWLLKFRSIDSVLWLQQKMSNNIKLDFVQCSLQFTTTVYKGRYSKLEFI